MALGLILSSSTMEYRDPTYDAGPASTKSSNFIGGSTGSAALNSSLSSPITSTGDFSRAYATTSNSVRPFGVTTVSSSIDSGLYVGPYSTSKAYSIRAWIRQDPDSEDKHVGVGFLMRGYPENWNKNTNDGDWAWAMGGYQIRLSGVEADGTNPGGGTTTGLWFAATEDSGATEISIQCSGAYVKNTWYRVRADIIPVGTAGDSINIYTSSAGDVPSGQETWELVLTRFIDATADTLAYKDPTDSALRMGWYNYSNDLDDVGYIDQLEILVEDL
jgi:hypothetical protein